MASRRSWVRIPSAPPTLFLLFNPIAALAVNSRGKRYSHQRRLTKVALQRALDILLTQARTIRRAHDFSELFGLMDAALEPIPGLGELYVYDASLRIGAKLNLSSKKVYLHAGTRLGALSRPAHRRGARRVGIAEAISRAETARNRGCAVHLQERIDDTHRNPRPARYRKPKLVRIAPPSPTSRCVSL